MFPPPSSPTSNTFTLPKKERVLKWAAFGLAVVLLWNTFLYLITIPFNLLSLLPLIVLASPNPSVLLSWPFIYALLYPISGIIVLITIFVLFRKKKYLILVILEIFLLIISVTYLRNFSQITKYSEKVGIIPSADDVPAGILNLPVNAIPAGYSSGKGQTVKYDFSPTEEYLKEYNANVRLGGDMDIIRFTYQEKECDDFYRARLESSEIATCKAGPCIIDDSDNIFPVFKINDNGACASVGFSGLRDNSLTREQAQKIVDSLERVPGERPKRSFEDKAKPIMKTLHSSFEAWKKQIGIYDDIKLRLNAPITLSEGDCSSTLNVDIAPDGQSYVIHRPVCPNNGMSYCIENDQAEIVEVPTERVEKTYHCK